MGLLENQEEADRVSTLYRNLEDRLMANIIRHCSTYKQPIDSDNWLLQRMAEIGKLNKEHIKIIAQSTGISMTAMERLLKEAADNAILKVEPGLQELLRQGLVEEAVEVDKSKGIKRVMKAFHDQAKDTLNMCNTTMLYKARDAYKRLVHDIAGRAKEVENKPSFLATMNGGRGFMIAIVFKTGEICKSTYQSIYQYNYGQVLRIQGLNLPPAVEVHFSLQNTGGEATTRIGVTKDGVTDVVIPDSFLENGDTTQNYEIYAFVYLRNETSGQTEYKITMHVTSRPKPEAFERPQDAEIFKEAIKAVNESAARSAESEKQAEGWAHGREDLPERTQDNAKYYAGKTEKDAEKTATDRKEVERLVESVSGIDEQVAKVENFTKQAQTSATNAALSEQAAKESENNAAQSRAGAEAAENNAELAAQKAEQDKAIVEQAKNLVKQMGQEVLDNKNLVDKTAQDFSLKAQQTLADVNNAGQAQTERVQTAGNDAVEFVKTAQDTAAQAVETAKSEAIKEVQTEGTKQTENVTAEGEKQVQAVQGAAQEIIADREQIQANKVDIALLKDIAIVEKASGKTIIIEDASDFPVESLNGTGKIIITGKNILKTEKYNEFVPLEAKAGTLFTLVTNGELSEGGNIKFIDENGECVWFAIDKGKTRVSAKIKKNVKGFVNLLGPKKGLKYCFSVGENDKYEEYVEQVITAPVSKEQLKTIHTNYPCTVLTSENEITVEYVADTEKYIGKRIKEENQTLQNQILEIQSALISQKISGGYKGN